jgi:Tfp pilus assembly protein PilX
MKRSTSLHSDQSGLVSITVALSFIIIMSLITTSFALLSRREQRQSLDRQLSTQAFYAAESGVNDAIQAVKAGTTNVDDCGAVNTNAAFKPNLGQNLSYTCVLVNESPTAIEETVSTDDSKVVRVQSSSNIGKLRISWQDANGAQTFTAPSNTTHYLPQQTFNQDQPTSYANNTGIVRAMIIPVSGALSRNSLINNTQTLFLYPLVSASVGQVGSYTTVFPTAQTSQGAFLDGQCNIGNINTPSPGLPQYCNGEVKGLSAFGTKTFYVRLTGIYQSSKVTIQAFADDGSTTALPLLNGQVVIDSTGKASDVLRRIQVRVPIQNTYYTPEYALESADDICKLLGVSPQGVVDSCEPYN